MMIDKIEGISPLSNVQNNRRTNGSAKTNFGEDTISLSSEAKKMAESYYLNQLACETPNIRAARVAEVKEKIKDPSYINDNAITSAADRIMDTLGI